MGGTIKAQQELNENLQRAGADTRKRKHWAYVRASALADWAETQNWETETPPEAEVQARRMFGSRLDAPVRLFDNGAPDGKLYAVWMKIEEPMEGEDPSFITNPPGPFITLDPKALEKIGDEDTEPPPELGEGDEE